jgi:hypothetical protein
MYCSAQICETKYINYNVKKNGNPNLIRKRFPIKLA